uniref:Transmembrane protein n=1 Tax=Macrostomum lignano TaxID=282301 RepID=A0A1I8ISG9_9PLAT
DLHRSKLDFSALHYFSLIFFGQLFLVLWMFSIVSRRSSRPSCAVSIACAAAFVLLLTLVACGQPADSASVNRAENPYMAAMFAKARPNCSFNQFMDSMACPGRRHQPAGSRRNAEWAPLLAGRVPAASAAAPPAPATGSRTRLESLTAQQFAATGQADLGVVQQDGLGHRLEQRGPLAVRQGLRLQDSPPHVTEVSPGKSSATSQVVANVRHQTAELDKLHGQHSLEKYSSRKRGSTR